MSRRLGLDSIPTPLRGIVECQGRMGDASLVVLDAPAMFEQLSAERAVTLLASAARAATLEGYRGVRLLRSRRLAGWLARNPDASDSRSDFVSFQRVLDIFALATAHRRVRFGDSVWEQTTGTPIGGLTSRTAASCVPGWCELAFMRGRNPACLPHARSRGILPDQALGLTRYVDDLLATSRMVCRECTEQAVRQIYAGHVSFARSEASDVEVSWLDMTLHADATGLCIRPRQDDLPWLATSGNAPPTRWRIQPPALFAHPAAAAPVLRSLRLGRETRWMQMALGDAALHQALALELATWIRAGWSWHTIRSVWVTPGRDPRVARLARGILARWRISPASSPEP